MKGVLSSMLPVGALVPVKEDEVEYSFAMEYKGPLVSYDLPRAVPIDIRRIPTAAVVAPSAVPDKVSLPVVQPLLSRDPLNKKLSKELTRGSDADFSPNSVIAFEPRSRDGYDCRFSDEFSNSDTVGFSNGHNGCCDLSDVIDDSLGAPDFSNSRERSCELSGGLGSSGTLDFSNSLDHSNDLSGSSGVLGSLNDCKESLDFVEDLVDDINPLDWGSIESVSSLHFLSSEISSCQGDDANDMPPHDAKRTSVVTFLDAESSGTVHEEVSSDKIEVEEGKIRPETKGRKGSCYRCYKGNRFTEKEVCIVCNAKYCSNCVLRAMGSMPEGRKCVSCIGIPIDESKRGSLGKCSRMLKRLLSQLEIQQIMNAEKLCEANQLQPELIYVNGKQLCQEELVLLQSCQNPPKKLKPGHYWYDKVSGQWGKEGQKPSRIITADLKVGGPIMQNASNGNTGILINCREITKVELRMLQLAGVQCAGKPHFWVNADGTYQEEGQKKMKGNIWDKSGTKLVCALLSLPVPCKASNTCQGGVNNLVNGVIPDYFGQRALQKLLLAGYKGSGSSTIFKQAKILYNSAPFSEDERENIRMMIQSNVYRYLAILLEGREQFEEESLTEIAKKHSCDQSGNGNESDDKIVYSIGPRLKAFSDWLLKVMVTGNLEAIFPAATREYAPLVEELWKDAAIQATYDRRSELQMLPTVASYFLERVVEICRTDYEPSNMDILYSEGITSSNGLACMDFSFPQSAYGSNPDTANEHDPLLRYQLIRVDARSLRENCKWLEMFEDVRLVIFCVALTDYDQFCDDGNGIAVNKMLASRRLFESIVTNPTFDQMDFLLILNKFDMFEQKIEQVPLGVCDWFNDFNPLISHHRSNNSSFNNNSSLAQQASYYIAVKFKRLFSFLTDRKLYVSMVNGLDSDTVDQALHYASEILKWDDERAYFSISEYSIYSTEASSTSH
ncbi:extra-large guanine nucleotide-binding protein 1-like isoform X2 [Telopea speciosissima]|uniref:extra-large guanine nucleotide-binding protein 1-like isoform X2 n=1 Tax=Telopea speciosissima TaxID=54955 RepID=UPI001CC351E9|nr:extra-large guanine nucleotide-binding protein 1-like isoform X2 [Telopea speciosissima]